MKMWAGRFTKELDNEVNEFNSSISIDHLMYESDIKGSIAHAFMLGSQNIIPMDDATLIIETLEKILDDLQKGQLVFDEEAEDIHMFVEAELTKRIGDIGKKLHTGRSRNDQVALDVRMHTKKEIENIKGLTKNLLETILDIAKGHKKTIMPGYTHLQRAQPITFAHYLLAYASMFRRDMERLNDVLKRTNWMPLGSAALAGTTYNIDRELVKKQLDFDYVVINSIDGVSDRDFAVELANAIALIMMHLSRFSEEIIFFCSWEFKFIELDDAYATGSSIMPQKKNPDIAELVRGKTGRCYGNLITLLTMLKGLPLAYNKDMQEDKEALFDSIKTVKQCLKIFAPMLKTMTVNKDNMYKAASKGYINATDAADYLVKKGLPFRDAYKIIGKIVMDLVKEQKSLEELPIKEYQKYSPLFDDDLYEAIKLENCVEKRLSFGGASEKSVNEQIKILEKEMEEL